MRVVTHFVKEIRQRKEIPEIDALLGVAHFYIDMVVDLRSDRNVLAVLDAMARILTVLAVCYRS